MDDIKILLERHEQRLSTLERDVKALGDIRYELKTMSETLVTLTTEMKHTNDHLKRNEEKISIIENKPIARMEAIVTAVVSALAGVALSMLLGAVWG